MSKKNIPVAILAIAATQIMRHAPARAADAPKQESAKFVNPPKGLKIGYVPIATRQADQ